MSLSLGMQWGKARRIEALESIYHEHPESGGAGEVLPVMLCPLDQGGRNRRNERTNCSHAFVFCDLSHLGLCRSGSRCAGAKRRRTMKPLKPIPRWLTIDVLIIVVGLGLIALGIFTAAARIFGTPV